MIKKINENIWESWPAEKKSDLIHNYVMRYADRNTRKIDYGTGVRYTSVEMHVLEKICYNPYSTITNLSMLTYRTKGAVSQIVKRLVEKGLVEKVFPEKSANYCHLYPTESGTYLNQLHLEYDRKNTEEFFSLIARYYTGDQLDAFFKVMDASFQLLAPDGDYPWTHNEK